VEGTIVVVDPDAAVAREMATSAEISGAEIIGCLTARRALNTCCALEPICVVTRARMDDFDALWLTTAIRSQPTAVAAVPVIVFSAAAEGERQRLLRAGADVVLDAPFDADALGAQIAALVGMASRIRERAAISSTRPLPGEAGSPRDPGGDKTVGRAFRGSLERAAVSTVLSVLELERSTGALSLTRGTSSGRSLVLRVASGAVTGGRSNDNADLKPLEAVDAALHWGPGRFEFTPGSPERPREGAVTLSKLLLATLGVEPLVEPGEEPATRPLPEERAHGRTQHSLHAATDRDGERTSDTDLPAPTRVSPTAASVAQPPRRSTLLSQPAQRHVPSAGTPPSPPRRRMSEHLRAAISVREAPPAPVTESLPSTHHRPPIAREEEEDTGDGLGGDEPTKRP
jgi:CheY-like chemotaxis protein